MSENNDYVDITAHMEHIMSNSFKYDGHLQHFARKHYIEYGYYHIVWTLIHTFTLTITREKLENSIYKQNIQYMILNFNILVQTCTGNCGSHYSKYLESYKYNIDKLLEEPEYIFEFFVDFHNFVNSEFNSFTRVDLHKKLFTYDEVKTQYSKYDYTSYFENLYGVHIEKSMYVQEITPTFLEEIKDIREKLKNKYKLQCFQINSCK